MGDALYNLILARCISVFSIFLKQLRSPFLLVKLVWLTNMKCLASHQFPAQVQLGGQEQIPSFGEVFHVQSRLLASDKDCLGKLRQGSFHDKDP